MSHPPPPPASVQNPDAAHRGLSEDAFLGGRLRLLQPQAGYRAGTDPVFLAAAVPACAGQCALDLGCGVGTAGLCLAARVEGLAVAGLELQEDYAALARENAARNGLAFTPQAGDLRDPPAPLRHATFDHVLMNPPYFAPGAAVASRDAGRDRAQREGAPLGAWIDAGLRRLKDKGTLSLIHRAERLDAVLAGLAGRAGDIRILPLAPRPGRPATRVIVRARKSVKTPLTLLAPLTVHVGDKHLDDRPDFSAQAEAVLRAGGALSLGP